MVATVLVVVLVLLFGVCRFGTLRLMEKTALTTGPNGKETPASVGVPFERVAIPSGKRRLDSYVVTVDARCVNAPVIVIYHGMQETISEWVKAQAFLYRHCVSSVIFDPTGSGDSPRPARLSAVREDSVAVYEFALARFPGRRVFVMGHSMGNGPMLEALPHFSAEPAGVIVADAFKSLRTYGGVENHLFYRVLSYTIPDWWNNVKAIRTVDAPVLVIHSDADQVNPVAGGEAIFRAAHEPRTQIILHGYGHNALYQQPAEEWWSGVFEFLARPAAEPAPARRKHGMPGFRRAAIVQVPGVPAPDEAPRR